MEPLGLLQEVGLSKYEAEAYVTLLRDGPLTGYEVGKHSRVPQPRSYDVVERLVERGLALTQPGSPPRYLAEDPLVFLARQRASMAATLDALATLLARPTSTAEAAGFWVVRGRANVLARARTMVEGAREDVSVALPKQAAAALHAALAEAEARGCGVRRRVLPGVGLDPEVLLVIVDGREALAGALTPEDRCQAVVSADAALRGLVGACLAPAQPAGGPVHGAPTSPTTPDTAWLDWEARKQRHLLRRSA